MAVAWTSIPDSDVDPESPITTSLMTALRDNPEGIAKGASGAPTIVTAALADGAVGQAQLKTAVQQTQDSAGTGSLLEFVFAGGQYSFAFGLASSVSDVHVMSTNDAGYVSKIATLRSSDTQITRLLARYIQASPPYNLGSGDIPLFAWVRIGSDGGIGAISVAPDPPWANNGPTQLNPANRRRVISELDDNGYRRPKWLWEPKQSKPESNASKAEVDAYLAWLSDPTNPEHWHLVEITQGVKNRDMHLIPHPFTGNDLNGDRVVLLDPCGPMMEQLLAIHEAEIEGESVSDLLQEDYLRIDNTELDVARPPGVMCCPVKWKST